MTVISKSDPLLLRRYFQHYCPKVRQNTSVVEAFIVAVSHAFVTLSNR